MTAIAAGIIYQILVDEVVYSIIEEEVAPYQRSIQPELGEFTYNVMKQGVVEAGFEAPLLDEIGFLKEAHAWEWVRSSISNQMTEAMLERRG